jgi:hypothetical protein
MQQSTSSISDICYTAPLEKRIVRYRKYVKLLQSIYSHQDLILIISQVALNHILPYKQSSLFCLYTT